MDTIIAISTVASRANISCFFGGAFGLITFTYKSWAKAEDPATNNPDTVENAAETPPAASRPTINGCTFPS